MVYRILSRRHLLSMFLVVLLVAMVATIFSTVRGTSHAASGDYGDVFTSAPQRTCSDARCGAFTTIPVRTWVQTWCWRDGGSYNGTPRWFRVIYSGRKGWVSASQMSHQPAVPYCSDLASGW